jgi:uncharacterized FlaG/YvyC family protein
MVERISNARLLRAFRTAKGRRQVSPAFPVLPPKADEDRQLAALERAIERLFHESLPADATLEIARDEKTGACVYRSVDPATGTVLAQWPPAELLELRRALRTMEGLLIDKTV